MPAAAHDEPVGSRSSLPPQWPAASPPPCPSPTSHRARDYGYCCGLFAPVDVEDCTARSSHAHSHFHYPFGSGSSDNNNTFWTTPLLGPLLFENSSSDARDHAANERTFLAYLRLSIYMAVVAVAITLSFHLKSKPTDVELRMARPLGLIFWLLAVACLALGFGNYMNTVNKYARRAAIVQTGWRTQSVCRATTNACHLGDIKKVMSLIGLSIVGTCVVLLVVAKVQVDLECDSLLADARCAARLRQALVSYYSRLGGVDGGGGGAVGSGAWLSSWQ
ncbi:hypothetical protein Micbo1qcDRAFT_175157 [Microdochium bolleyi]|uniref:DUF202 domain-containing protein n=1 Tax=Microdochium bolleyi TaxID=196109 RepID=A0A136J4T6_9PEZI|nr:hypothetical protein Micbo1qcDRAFT_175157 [Microdochium bolleyi]